MHIAGYILALVKMVSRAAATFAGFAGKLP